MITITYSFIVMGIQDLKQHTLNLTYIDISASPSFLDLAGRYPANKFIFRFRLMSITLSTSIMNVDNTILITCVGLNDCHKDVNGIEENILAVIYTENVGNWEHLKTTSSWINIDLVDYLEVQEASNTLFSFITESIHDISKFDIYLENSK